MDDIDDDQSCAAGGPEWQRGFEAGREQGRREVPATPASAWRPIAEAPWDGTRVLLHVEGVDRPVLGQWDGSEWVTLDANDWSGRNLLSWSALPPLPTPPTSTKGG